MATTEGPCNPWAEHADTTDCSECNNLSGLSPAQIDYWLEIASSILFRLSAKKYNGICNDVVRPCSRRRWFGGVWTWDWVYARSMPFGYWGFGSTQDFDPAGCGQCNSLSQIDLGAYPVTAINEVWVDGVQLPPTAYRIDDFRWLVRLDGEHWPCCQDLTADPFADPDTFLVDFDWGRLPPIDGQRAAIELGCELAKSCDPSQSCRLPQRVTNLTRQGVSMTLLDPQDFLDKGRTGLYFVDLFLVSVNPRGNRRGAFIASPDYTPPVRRTGP